MTQENFAAPPNKPRNSTSSSPITYINSTSVQINRITVEAVSGPSSRVHNSTSETEGGAKTARILLP
jgi:hypothetical protein